MFKRYAFMIILIGVLIGVRFLSVSPNTLNHNKVKVLDSNGRTLSSDNSETSDDTQRNWIEPVVNP